MTDATTTATTTTAAPWHHGVDAETIGFWQNKGYDLADPKTFATKITEHYRNAEKHIGVPQDRLLRLPEKADDEAGWKSVHQRLGAPKDVKEYDFNGIKFADGKELDEQFTTTMRSELLKANVAKDKAPDIVKAVVKHLDDADKAEATIRESEKKNQVDKVLKDWGQNRNENELMVRQAMGRLEMSQADFEKFSGAIGWDRAAEILRKIGSGFREAPYVDGQSAGPPPTAMAAKAQLDQLTNDPAWGKKLLNRDAATVAHFQSLTEQISGVSRASL